MSDASPAVAPLSEKKLRFRTISGGGGAQGGRVHFNEANRGLEELAERERCPSLFSFLRVELTRAYVLEHDEERYSARREKVYSFMKIPREVEKFMSYGFMQCADSFLYVYTFLPVRVAMALWAFAFRPFSKCFGQTHPNKTILTPAEICDILKALILIVCSVLMFYIDTNMMYHLIKSQSVIKLYIFYNMLEVGDRLFSAFGQDTIDALFWTATEPRDRRREHLGVIPHLIFAIVYVFLHSLLVLCQATTLNVAVNSNNKALLTIMMSNNFVELKGSVFKKFDKNNLFQVSCSDVRERFHLFTLLFIVVLQTMREYSWKTERFWVLLPDCLIVLTAEIFVDWIKHAFITRFNELQVDVYRDYTTSLAYDMAQTRQKHAFSDHSDLVARRMGFIPLPLGVVMIRVLAHAVQVTDVPSVLIVVVGFMCLGTMRVLNGIFILGMACDLITQHKQEKASTQSPTQTSFKPKDTATSPMKPLFEPVTTQPVINNNTDKKPTNSVEALNIDLGTTAIFSNSTVDLKNVSLNDELLKVEGEEVHIETVAPAEENVSKSNPNLQETIEEVGMKKRAESEPNLANCNEEED